MRNLRRIIYPVFLAIGPILFGCEKEEESSINIEAIPAVIEKNPYIYSEQVRVFDSEKTNYAIVTVEAKTEIALKECIGQYRLAELTYDFPTKEQCQKRIDFSQFKFNANPAEKAIKDSIREFQQVRVHYDFTIVLENIRKETNNVVGFGFSMQDNDRGVVPFSWINVSVGSATSSPLADGFGFTNNGPRATFDIYRYSYIGLLSFDVGSGGSISAPVVPGYANQLHYIESVDITWPYQKVSAAGVWYHN